MKKRRKRLLSMALACGLILSSFAPYSVTAAAANGTGGAAWEDVGRVSLSAGEALSGIYAEYYTTTGSGTNVQLANKISEGIDYHINWSDMDGKLAATTGKSDYAGVRWTGRIKAPETGNYKFYAYSDNGFRLWLNGEQLINYWNSGSWDIMQTSKTVELEEGQYYDFQVDYMEYSGGSHVYLYWTNDQSITERVTIPSDAYYLPEDFANAYLSSIDTSEANLVAGEKFDGKITVEGSNLTSAGSFAVVNSVTGDKVSDITEAEVLSDTQAVLELPSLSVGTYRLRANVEGTVPFYSVSSDTVIVKPDMEGEIQRPENPRPDWERDAYVNLNGWWDFEFDPDEVGQDNGWYEADYELSRNIQVPFCWESPYSGIVEPDYKGQAWYQRTVDVDSSWAGKKLFLKFGAVDWKSKLWVNGQEVGSHIGGYSPFEFDITDYVKVGEENVITLWVEDKGNYGDNSYPALVGKQGRNAPCGYTHTSGIWQTVGLEARSATYLENAKATADVDNSTVNYALEINTDEAQDLTVEYAFESTLYNKETDKDELTGSNVSGTQTIHVEAGESTVELAPIAIEDAKLWNHNTPNLYEGNLTVKDSQGNVLDSVDTYFGMRKIETKYYNDDESLGVQYIYVNGAPVYLSGLLDQGFWEEGIYTAPSEEALKYDILAMREAGFNMIRKHLKIEDPLQYYWCDKLGMYVWQDMPHATAMVPSTEGGSALGRRYYEDCLEATLDRDYNHPSVIAVMLFNETWGINYSSEAVRNRKADDGMSTKDWFEYLYNLVKEKNPTMLVEDMSPCNQDHVQPTDLNTYHTYPSSYSGMVSTVESFVNNAYVGSTKNFKFGETQDGEPLLNSEYGGVGAYAGDYDVSYCFKYMTDIQRRYIKQSGFVYTEPYDIEYERNGIMTYDRNMKIFGYDEVAYGGDMTTADLLQEIYVGLVDTQIKNVTPGERVKVNVLTVAWTYDLPEDPVVKWRFDGTDIYGNNISTNLSGTIHMDVESYVNNTATISFNAPTQACVGTLTVWIEDGKGEKVAKNFINIVVADESSKNEAQVITGENGAVTMKAAIDNNKYNTTEGTGAQSYSYVLPEDFDLADLNGLRVIAEASSYKGQMGTDKNSSTYSSENGQTAVGRELASDMTVSVNGVEIDTVYLPDNPRDIRGTLTLNNPSYGNASAGDFGYLVNLNITSDKLSEIKETIGEDRTLTVTYSVKEDAEHPNGIRIYNSIYGRYAVNPTIILNPEDTAQMDRISGTTENIPVEENNYSVEGNMSAGAAITVRNNDDGGYTVALNADGTKLSLVNAQTGEALAGAAELTGGAHQVKVTLFDEQIRVYVDHNPEPAIFVYDRSGFTGGITAAAEDNAEITGLTVSPESYSVEQAEIKEPEKYSVYFEEDFSDPNYTERYQIMGTFQASVVDEQLKITYPGYGGKMILDDSVKLADGVYEMDMMQTQKHGSGNIGFVFRASNFTNTTDGADGYYAGIGDGFIHVGRMNQGWTELAKIEDETMTVNEMHHLKVTTFGNKLQVYVDYRDTPCVDVEIPEYTEGSVAVRGFLVSGVVDNIKIATTPYYKTSFDKGINEWLTTDKWKVVNGAYTGSTANGYALIESRDVTDSRYAADVAVADEESCGGLLFRAKEDGSGYRAVVNAAEDKIQLTKTEDGVTTVIEEADWNVEAGENYRITAQVVGDTIKIFMNDQDKALITAEDRTFAEGLLGVCSVTGTAMLDNVAIDTDYIVEPVTVAFDANGGKEVTDTIEAKKGEAYGPLPETSRVGYTFLGWYNGTELITEDTICDLDADVTLTAKWEDTLIAFMEKLNGSQFSEESWAAFEEALAYAKEVEANPESTSAELNEARAALLAAFGSLEYDVQRLHLQIALEAAQAILDTAGNYDEESLQALRDIIDEATAVLENESATQEEVNEAAGDVLDALAEVKGNKDVESLKSLIEAAESLVGSKYTDESLAVLEEAIAFAKTVAENADREEADLSMAYKQLGDAIRGLEMKGNKAALSSMIDKANEILTNASAYVESSISGLEAVLEEAQVVYDNANATQTEVNAATQTLTLEIVKARLKGDVDRDGRVSTKDSAEVLKYSAELAGLTGEQLEGADVNGDGQVDTKDAALILQYTAEKISAF